MAASIVIREATAADDDGVWNLLKPVFASGTMYSQSPDISREAALEYWGGGSHRVFVAETPDSDGDGGLPAVIGTYFLTPNLPVGSGGGHVANAAFVVSLTAAGRGIGRQMLEHALAEAVKQGFLAMQFNYVIATNTRAIALWERYGFKEVGRLPKAFRHPTEGFVDVLVMYKQLVPDVDEG
eukprot:m.459523 g.459523  ORF g.459523 m.459523 type:complete len:182 (+) comp21774_c0_seq1:86-631(+)